MNCRIENNNINQKSLLLVQDILEVLLHDIDSLNDFKNTSINELNRTLGIISTNITSFVEISTLCSRYFGFQTQDSKESHIALLYIMNSIHNSLLKSDLIALEELIKHDLKDNLGQWKTNFLPLMIKQVPV